MASITIEIPSEFVERVLDGFAGTNGYQETILDDDCVTMIKNPENKASFAKRILIEKILADVSRHEESIAISLAIKSVRDDLKEAITIT